MGAILAFPSRFRDYTDSFTEWKQQTFSSLSVLMRQVITVHERSWTAKLAENLSMSMIVMDVPDQVHPGVWIGSYSSAADDAFLGKEIDVVLNMAIECDYALSVPKIQLVKIGIEDGRLTNTGVFGKAAEVIHQARSAGKTVLVHCAAGVSRSSTAVLAYLMLYENMGWVQALEHVQKSRPCVNPHPLLVRSLIRDLGSDFIP
ncbi:MAG: dual specificity protein phosphatase family protein [Lysobacterales bacterium]|nr:MAG: dual specificity protein phosphatase family protein [Xanthomonadales bacterium]